MPGAAVAVATSAVAATTIGGTIAAGLTFSFSVGTFAFSLAASLALGAVSKALQSKPNTSQANSANSSSLANIAKDRTLTFRQPITAHRIIYGECRVSGPMTFIESTDDNEHLHQLVTIAGHPVQEIAEFWINDEKVTIDGNNQVSSGEYAGDHITILTGDGTVAGDSALRTELESATEGWTSNHKQTNRAKIYTKFSHDPDIYVSSIPNTSALVKGKKIYDTRDAGTRYSNNPALIVYDYLVDSDVGVGESSDRINTESFTTAANICDEDVTVVLSRTFTVDNVTDLLSLSSSATGIRTGDKCRVENSGGALPSPLAVDTDYFYIAVSDSTGKVALTKEDAIAGNNIILTDDGTGTQTIKRRQIRTFTVDASTDIITLSSKIKELLTGDGLEVSTDDTLPTGLSASTTYYWIRLTDTTGKLATTRLNALAGTAIDVTDTGTGTHSIERTVEPRYSCNGTVDTNQTPKNILENLLTSMAGSLVYQNGQWSIYAGAYRTPTITINEDDIVAPMQIQTRTSRRELSNRIKGVYVSPADNYQPTDIPAVTNATYLAEDNNEELWKDSELEHTISPSMAQRIMKIDLERIRQQIVVNLTTNLTGLRLQAGDTVYLTNSRMGWSSKVFEVVEWGVSVQKDSIGNPVIVCPMKLRETASTIYDWDGGEETVTDLAENTTLPSANAISSPTGLMITEELYTARNGAGVRARAKLSWTAPTTAFVRDYLVQAKKSTDSEYQTYGRTDLTSLNIDDVSAGTWNFRVYAFNTRLRKSDPLNKTQEIYALSSAPSALTGMTIGAIGGLAVIRWDKSTDLDVTEGGNIHFRHTQDQSSPTWGESVSIGNAVDGGATVAILPLKEGAYLAKAVDSTGNESSAVSVSTKQATALAFINSSQIDEHSAWAGTHNGTVEDSGVLKLEGADNVDDWVDVDLVSSWDVGEAGLATSGEYTLSLIHI